ncbi:MAG TPA: elongation factor 4, partial [Planctomycetaceae bacterium]|nr:elongation factor 4 [Planctomycetaceae bacterium]
ELLDRIVKEAPPPSAPPAKNSVRALVFDFKYSPHHGVILLLRMFAGRIRQGSPLTLLHSGSAFQAREVGIFTPFPTPSRTLEAGEIGYVVTGIKEPRQVRIGDTLTAPRRPAPPLPGFQLPQPKIWASFYPETQAQLNHLRRALERLQLSDSSLTYEEERSGVLGRGFRVGFLGLLHLDITAERLRREHQLKIIAAAPTLNYTVELRGSRRFHCRSAAAFPNHGMVRRVWEPWVRAKIFSPAASFSALASLWHEYEVKILNCTTLPDEKIVIEAELPLRELMRGFYDRLKSATSGYASLSYELIDEREGELIRLDVLLAGNEVPALARIVPRHRAEREARNLVQQLKETLPRQLYTIKIQARALGRIVAAEHLPALRKNVTAHLYGGDITRKKKLWQKQKR